MWELARPLIEDWMIEHMGPEARMREAAEDMLDTLERLPKLIADMEESVGSTARNGLRLDPATLESFVHGQRQGGSWRIWALAAAAAVIAVAIFD